MGWWRQIAAKLATKPRAGSGGAAVSQAAIGGSEYRAPAPKEGDRAAIARDGYGKATLIHAAIVEFATSLAEPPLVAERDSVRLLPSNNGLARLTENWNDTDTPFEFSERIGTDMKLQGEWIAHLSRSNAGIIGEVWPLRVDRCEVIPDDEGGILRYEMMSNGRAYETYLPSDIIHLKLPNPLNDFRGLSPIYVLMLEGRLDYSAVQFLDEFFRNGGIPRTVVTSQQKLSDSEAKAIAAKIDEAYGPGHRHGTLVLGMGATAQPLGIDVSKLDLAPIFDIAESRCCAVLQVPAILVGARIGLLQAQAYGTAREARRSWWGETLIPFGARIGQALTRRIAREFGPGMRLRYDLSGVQAVLEAQSQVLRDSALAFSSNLLSRNEARSRLGLLPADDRNVYAWELAAASTASVDAETTEELRAISPRRLGAPPVLPELVGGVAA